MSSTLSGRPPAAVVLAAGEGRRMRSARPKVMHEIAGLPMVGHALASLERAGVADIAVVVGPDHEETRGFLGRRGGSAAIFEQRERRGTAHAVLQARPVLERAGGAVLVMFGDTPLVRPETVRAMLDAVEAGSAVVVLGFEAADPTGYGRLLVENGELVGIREHKDASEAQRRITLCNGGLMAFDGRGMLPLLDRIGSDNAQGEFYLTDAVALARAEGGRAGVVIAPESEIQGINDRTQLAVAEAEVQMRLRRAAMQAGVTLRDPASVHFSHDTEIAPDVTIEPHVVFGPGVRVGAGTVVHAFSHLAGVTVDEGAVIGPFARLRPGAAIGEGAHVGNFVEIKNATVEAGAKINHLSYIGDARVGAGSNIGAGTITCNYDGFGKYHTDIGANAFVGSNSSLVAPVSIGDGAYVGSGSVITEDVPADALAVARGRQAIKPGWAGAFRERPENVAKASARKRSG